MNGWNGGSFDVIQSAFARIGGLAAGFTKRQTAALWQHLPFPSFSKPSQGPQDKCQTALKLGGGNTSYLNS